MKVQEGVWQSIHQSHKYKTNMLMIKFITLYDGDRAAYQNLLARMIEDGSLTIGSRSELEQRLACLYGANFGISVRRQGNYLEFTLLSSIVREDLLPETTNLVEEWYSLIHELLFHQAFDERVRERFEREKALLIQKRHRQKDDKSYQAAQCLFERVYEGQESDAFGSQGSLTALERVSLSNIANEYRSLLTEGQIHVNLHGVVNEELFKQWIASLPLGPRYVGLDYHHNHLAILTSPYQLWQGTTIGEQTQLVFAYHFEPILEMEKLLVAALANALLGALPTSELFVSIREQKSLTYDIMSAIDFQRHLVLIHAGVAHDKGEVVAQEIQQSLQHLIQTLDEMQLAQAKVALLHYEINNRDVQETELLQLFSKQVLPEFDLSLENYRAIFERITVQAIVDCLKQWRPVGCYVLKGGG